MALAIPRGFTKSTIISFAYVVWNIIKEDYKFIVIVSATYDLAEDTVDFMKLEFSDNKKILEDFGQLIHEIAEKADVTINKTRILARGRKTAVRGFKNR